MATKYADQLTDGMDVCDANGDKVNTVTVSLSPFEPPLQPGR